MGLFGLFKKSNSYFDKKTEPKCAYCEHGKPAKSEGKILCPRSGIVDENYSCKKFSYSPFLRIPEKEHPPTDNSLIGKSSEALVNKSNQTESTENVSENLETTSKTTLDAKIKDETPQEEEIFTQVETVDSKKNEIKKEIPQQSEISKVSDIKYNPHNNSENIKQLESISNIKVEGIENHPTKKKIILPDISKTDISSISNSIPARNSDEYLKTINIQSVESIENDSHTTHTIPAGTEKAEISELNNK